MRRYAAALVVVSATFLVSAPASAQFAQQGPKLAGTGVVGGAQQGTSVAVSADGNTAIVGGPLDDTEIGAAWIYTRSGGTWSQQGAKLVGTGWVGHVDPNRCCSTYGASQGVSVAISADGNTALVGGGYDNDGVGAAWVFVRSAGTWSQQGPKLVGTGGDRAFQGIAVALSADGDTALVGGFSDGYGAGGVGATWAFTRSGSTWAQQGSKLVGTGAIGTAGQGYSVALSADGNTALVGGFLDNAFAGAAWIFTRSGSSWSQQAELTGDPDAEFGVGTALSADGNTAAIAGEISNPNRSLVWTFTRSGTTWSQQGSKLTLVGGGAGVSLSGDASRLLVSSFFGSQSKTAGPELFLRNAGNWVRSGPPLVGAGAVGEAIEGYSAALSSDGLTAISGGNADNSNTGAVWIFRQAPLNGDADGDGRSDITVYNTTSGVWSSLTSASAYTGETSRGWGGSDYTPVPGDYDGDGKADLAVYQQSSGYWYVLLSSANFSTALMRNVGGADWLPVPGDYDGDGTTDLVVYNTATGQWYGLTSGSNYAATLNIGYGGSGYTAVPADFDGDGKADIGVYQPATGLWSVLLSSASYASSRVIYVGGTGWSPVPADYDGDGRADFVVYNDSTGQWYGLLSSTNYTTTINTSWGGTGYAPVKGDYDGDGRADFAVYHQASGDWYIVLSSTPYTRPIGKNLGGPGSDPVPKFR